MSNLMSKIKNFANSIGLFMFLVGLGGAAGACEGRGSFLASAILVSVGIGMALWGYQK